VTEPFDLRLRLPARAENVAVVRQALSGMAEGLGMGSSLLADMKTGVTEACNNVVVHAYPDGDGVLEVDVRAEGNYLTVIVRDEGVGMQPKAVQPDEPSLGLGLPLIAALSNAFEIRGGSNRGIEVRMRFAFNGAEAHEWSDAPAAAEAAGDHEASRLSGVSIAPGPIMAPVLGRVAAMFAARSDFSLDRLSDAVLVTDAISAHVGDYAPGRHASIAFQDGEGKLEVRVGPLVEGGADELLRLMKLPGLEESLQKLADEVTVERGAAASEVGAEPASEYLQLRLSSGD
jgi:serine/threonine-protein kinase RsbW